MAISAAFANPLGNVLDFDELGRPIEQVLVTGSTGAANDTVSYSPRFLKSIYSVIGPVTATAISSGATTLKALVALGNQTTQITLVGNLNGSL